MKRTMIALCGVLAVAGCATTPLLDAGVKYVDEFNLSGTTCGYGRTTRSGLSVLGEPLKVAGVTSSRGFGSQAEGAVVFRTNGKVTAFDAKVGVDDGWRAARHSKNDLPKAVFKVWKDGRIVWTSQTLKGDMKPADVHVDLTGAREIILETSSGAPWIAYDVTFGDWLDARFTCEAGATLEVVSDPTLFAQLGLLTPPAPEAPRFNGADIWGVRPGREVIFRVPVSGVRPMTFSAQGLPDGVTLDAKGVLRGTAPLKAGDYDIVVTASNAKGRATRTIRLAVGKTISLTPPMGWNSWNTLCYRLTDQKVRDAARALEESGLGDYGWAYINLDDWWEMNNSDNPRVEMREKDFGREDVKGLARDKDGRILTNRSFPDMKSLTDYIHSFGFKAGLYSSPGPVTCGQCEGSYGHELLDAESWANWGFDYIKYDWCSYDKIFAEKSGWGTWEWQHGGRNMDPAKLTKPAPKQELYIAPYKLMNECLEKQNRDIVYSYCQYGIGESHEWARRYGANCWRSWEDMKDTWPWMERALEGQIGADQYWKYNGPGCWADPDMMIVGQQYSFGYDHPSCLTPNEQYTHVSLWAMVGSPLLIGCDLTTMDAFTKNLLMNSEVIAISQDRLGKTAKRLRHTDTESVWVRPLSGGATAVALVNRSPIARDITVHFADIELNGRLFKVRDVWRQSCEGRHAGSYTDCVLPHATKLIRLEPVDCPKCD